MNLWDKVQDAGKAFLGAIAAALVLLLEPFLKDPTSGLSNVDLPKNGQEWLGFFIAAGIGFLLPWLKRNFPSVEKAEKNLALAQERVETGKQSK